MKKFLSVLLSVVMLLSVTAGLDLTAYANTNETYTDGYYSYTVTDGKATITDCDTSISGDQDVSATLGGYPVTSIGSFAFKDCTDLTVVTIPDSVTSICNDAFAFCSSLKSIAIPAGVTSIGCYAFESCSSLVNIKIPDNVTAINSFTFSGCKALESITLPDGLLSIEKEAFAFCSSLTNIVIPDSVTSIGDSVFYLCNNLKSVTIGSGVTNIGTDAFENCSNLTKTNYSGTLNQWAEITFASGGLYGGSNPIYCSKNLYINDELVTDAVLTNATKISNYAFQNCESLTSITIPEGVTNIGIEAFYNCTNLASITLPESATTISYGAFENCTSLASVNLPSGITKIASNTFDNCRKLTSITIPYGVTSIGYSAFESCSKLESAVIPNSVTTIESYAFSNCNMLSDLTIPESVTSIGANAFTNCSNLESITIPDGVTSIGYHTFFGSGLKSISIPDSVTSIGDGAFTGSWKLESITISGNVESIGEEAFRACNSLTAINIDDSNKNYSSQDGVFFNKDKTDLICCPGGKQGNYTIPDTVTSIHDYAFLNCDNLIGVTIPNSVAVIGKQAFYASDNLKNVTIPNSVTSIGEEAFSYCSSLTSAAIGSGVTEIDGKTFYVCRKLECVTIPNSITSIDSFAFSECDSLKDVYYLGSKTEWEAITIASMNSSLSSATIHYNCFVSDSGLICSVLDDGTVEIARYSGSDTEMTVPSEINGYTVSSIGNNAFKNCSSLTEITIPSSITSVGTSAFKECSGLTDVYYSGSETQWQAIAIGEDNDCLINATIHYDFTNPNCVHSYKGAVIKEATCTEKGTMSYTCDLCKSHYYAAIPALGHNYVDGICERCNAEEYKSIYLNEPLTVEIDTVGKYKYYRFTPQTSGTYNFASLGSCDTFGSIYDENMDMLADNDDSGNGSNFSISYYFEAGTTYILGCKLYSDSDTYSFDILVHEHAYVSSVTEPTCEKSGYTTYTCSYCQSQYTDDYIDAKGHNFENDKCTNCGLEIGTINISETKTVQISTEEERKYYKFVPSESGTYIFYSTGEYDTYGYIYSENMVCLASSDDDGDNYNFSISYDFEAGKTYYLAAKIYSYEIGEFNITLKTNKTDYTVPTVPSAADTSNTSSNTVNNNSAAPQNGIATITDNSNIPTTPTTTTAKPKATTAKKVKAGKKKIDVQWKKVSGVKGYQVQVATDKKFKKNKKTVTIKKQKTTKTTIKKLKSKKKYYVRVRTYKTVNGKKVYSKWSKVKTVKTK